MRKRPYILLFIIIIAVISIFSFFETNSKRIKVTNTGSGIIEVKTDCSNNKVLLGQNGTGYFDRDSKIQIGNATIKFDKRVEVVNTGSDIIQITYNNTSGYEQKLLLGERGTGYISKTTPFKIKNAIIQVN